MKMIKKRNFSTICIMAGSPSNDLKAARIMQEIKKQAPETKFIGMGGDQMLANGLNQNDNYGDVKQLLDKPFFPYKNFLRFHIEKPWHPVLANLHYKNRKALKQLEKNNFFQDLLVHQPSAFLTVGNEFFAKDLYCQLNQFYEQFDQVKPPCILQERFVHNQRTEFKFYLDHFLYTVPKDQVNWRYSTFPSTNVGQEGVFKALHFLYSRNEYFQQFITENTIPIQDNAHLDIVEQLVSNERDLFRKKYDLNEDQYVFFLAPGDSENEIKKNLKLFEESINLHIKQTGQNPSNFAVVVSLKQNQSLPAFPIKTIQVNNETEKFEGMSACDMAFAVNGEIVNECCALQLPTIVINEMKFFQSYFTLLYNQFDSDLNLSIDGMVNEELMACKYGDAFPGKIADYMSQYQNQPKTRYVQANKLNKTIKQMLPKQIDQAQETDVVEQEKKPYNVMKPSYLASQRVLEAAKTYESLDLGVKRYQLENERNKMISNLHWD